MGDIKRDRVARVVGYSATLTRGLRLADDINPPPRGKAVGVNPQTNFSHQSYSTIPRRTEAVQSSSQSRAFRQRKAVDIEERGYRGV